MEIKQGTLSQRLLKPIHPLIAYSAENLAALPLRAILCVPIAIIALAAGRVGHLPSDPGGIAIWCSAMLGAWLINFGTMALIGSLAFVMESSTAVFEAYLALFMVFSGYLVPLELFPPWLRAISNALPFRYSLAFPVEVLVGLLDRDRWLVELGFQWAFVLALLAASALAWRGGVRRFSAFGG